jgi:predicted methyltransferase MtxX (methanogen marker protein 4)
LVRKDRGSARKATLQAKPIASKLVETLSIARRCRRTIMQNKDNSDSRVLNFMTEAGLTEPQKVGHQKMLFGHIAYYRALA